MKFPGYPSNREADEGPQATAARREGGPEDEAKPGDLDAQKRSETLRLLLGQSKANTLCC